MVTRGLLLLWLVGCSHRVEVRPVDPRPRTDHALEERIGFDVGSIRLGAELARAARLHLSSAGPDEEMGAERVVRYGWSRGSCAVYQFADAARLNVARERRLAAMGALHEEACVKGRILVLCKTEREPDLRECRGLVELFDEIDRGR